MHEAFRIIALTLAAFAASCGGGSESNSPISTVPSDVPSLVRQQYLAHATPPAGYTYLVPWLTSIHDERSSQPSRVQVDYLRAYCGNADEMKLISAYEYNDGRFEGGLWQRRPNWFASGYIGPLPYTTDVSSGSVSFEPSAVPAAAWHPWATWGQIPTLPAAITKCWMEARVLISGAALVQGGLDYYKGLYSSPPLEAGVSNWYVTTGDWQVITFGK